MNIDALIKKKRAVVIGVVLFALTWAVYGQTLRYDFVNYDDDVYVYANPTILRGLTFSNIGWAFPHFLGNNWHPLTTISHMLDCQLFGVNAGADHFVNVLLHSLAAVLLFVALFELTSTVWASAFVAAIFAIHPLHVESVAWIAERKDVLSAFFFALTLGAYARYVRKPSAPRYITMSIFLALGLMSKAMLVTTPVVLLLLDYWPLARIQRTENRGRRAAKLLIEKIPLFVLSAAVSAVTWFAQKNEMPRFEVLPIGSRIANALAAYLVYIWQMIWPAKLALAYPRPENLPILQVAGAAALLIAITLASIALRKRYPYFIVGWFWYVIMLLPVIGLAQVGGQAHADRYTYLPQIGLYIVITWSMVGLVRKFQAHLGIVGATAVMIVFVFAAGAWAQTKHWRDSETLWRHSLAVTSAENDVAHFYLGEFLLDHQRTDEALTELQMVAAHRPDDAETHYDLGNGFLIKNQMAEAVTEFQTALKIDPKHSDAETALANALLDLGRGEDAIPHFRNVLRLHPTKAAAHYNLGRGLYRQQQISEAIVHYKEALAIDPNYPGAASSLTEALLQTKQSEPDRFRPKQP
jgi:protein O-mannosyl-transferase